mgnify:CR=1 FL=1
MQELELWWEGLDAWAQWLIRDSIVVVIALMIGFMGKFIIERVFVSRGADACMRFPWVTSSPEQGSGVRPQTPGSRKSPLTSLAGYIVLFTVLAFAGWTIASWRGQFEIVQTIRIVLVHGWQVAVVVYPIIILGGWLVRHMYAFLQTPWLKKEMDALFPGKNEKGDSFSDSVAKAICVVVYAAFFLFIPVAIAAIFDITALHALIVPAWQICARLLTALVVFAVGYLGVAWARAELQRAENRKETGTNTSLRTGDTTDNSADMLANHLGLMIIVATVVLALGMVVGVSGLAGALVMVAILGFLLWPVRNYIRDFVAGGLLRLQRVETVHIDGGPAVVKDVTPLITELDRNGETLTRRNWDVLNAALNRPIESQQSNPPPMPPGSPV